MSAIGIEVSPQTRADDSTLANALVLPENMRILFGSEMGNAELVADNLHDALTAANITSECVALNDLDVAELPDLGVAIFVISTCGEGDLPYNAEKFWQALSVPDAPSLGGLKYAVLALGDSGYTYFCDAGVKLDARLAELGAQRIAERTDCDVSYVAPSNAWIAERVAQFTADGDPAAEAAAAAIAANTPTGPQWNRETPFIATLTKARLLSGENSGKEIRHYEIDISGSEIQYHAGDSIGIVPRNADSAVKAFLAAAKLAGDEQVDGRAVRDVAADTWELRFPSSALLEAVSEAAPESELARALDCGDHAGGEAWIHEHGVIETLQQLASPLPLEVLGAAMGPLRYRAYSIASTPTTNPDRVHITVATQRNDALTGLRSGVGTGHLADDVVVGGTVSVFPLPNRSFRLPEQCETPIIMVGPGVGVAPFRGFVQERAALDMCGPAWLFFGDQHEATDYLYAEEWEEFQRSGALTRIDTAFSRDTEKKVYVQDRMRENGAELVRWLSEGAYFYVCGDGKRMAADVDAALCEIAAEHLGAEQGEELIARLHSEKRYLRDVY